MRRNPLIYEINTWVWLNALSQRCGHTVTLGDIPDDVMNTLASWHFDAVWLMGVWERSIHGREIAQVHPDLQREYERTLPGHTLDQIVGSPYAIRRYAVDPHLGGRNGLAIVREQLRQRGISLILDFVPNHVAVDHHWTVDCPGCLVPGTAKDLELQPGFYFVAADAPEPHPIFAHGRDPYFPAWTDTAQVDAFSPTAREQAAATMLDIASQCDGVRCDMAMLVVNRIFAQTWKQAAEHIPTTEYWQAIIPAVKAKHADFVFMAEVYWDMEFELQTLGFDYTYDKRLYDRLRGEDAGHIRDHLLAGLDYQCKMVRFIENHDEARAMAAFGLERSRAAAVLAAALPGMKLIHEGQLEGRQLKLPVQLGYRSHEIPNENLIAFYRKLIDELQVSAYHDGIYMALGVNSISSNDTTCKQFIAFAWALGDEWRIAVVNFSAQKGAGRVLLPSPKLAASKKWRFENTLHPDEPLHLSGDDLLVGGLALHLKAYEARIYRLVRA